MQEKIIRTQMLESGSAYGKTNTTEERCYGAAPGTRNCPKAAAQQDVRLNSNKKFRRVILK